MSREQWIQYRAYRHSSGAVTIADAMLAMQQLVDQHGDVVLLRPKFVGICSADIRELRGERPGRTDFGHEVVATVVDSTYDRNLVGANVVLNPFATVVRETAFAETMYLAGPREALASALLEVPAAAVELAVVEPLACAIHAAGRAQLSASAPALVLGAGFFGYLLYCYLELNAVPVFLANRTADRLDSLRNRSVGLQIASDLAQHSGRFATVFLMQARLTPQDVALAAELVCDGGEIVLFGAIDPAQDAALYATRNLQRRVSHRQGGKSYFLQGTLDASREDLAKAIAALLTPSFVSRMRAVFAPMLTFEQGAAHLNERARLPRSHYKYMISM